MGKITTVLHVFNHEDEIFAKKGTIQVSEIRNINLTNVLIDTGATTLCLPARYIAQLGLETFRTVNVQTVHGITEKRIFEDVTIKLGERHTVVECIEIDDNAQPLLGVIPLEAMGIELDMQHQQVKFLPYDSLNTYIALI